MATRSDNNKQFRCSFCNKTQDQVRKLVAGPKGVYICDECIEVCMEIMEDEFEGFNEDTQEINLMKPKEMKAFLDDYVIGQDEAGSLPVTEDTSSWPLPSSTTVTATLRGVVS